MPKWSTSAWMATGTALLTTAVAGCSGAKSDSHPAPIFQTRRPAPIRRPVAIARPRPPGPAYPSLPAPRPKPPSPPAVHVREWIPPGGIQRRWTDIIIHHSASAAGGAKAFDRHHRKVRHWDELGYHFVIGNGTHTPDGSVEVGSRWIKQKHGAHCKTPDNYYNDHGVGVCLVGNFQSRSPSPAQLASLNRLLGFLTRQCGVSADRIHGHGKITGKTACPGRYFPLARVKQNLGYAGRPLTQAYVSY